MAFKIGSKRPHASAVAPSAARPTVLTGDAVSLSRRALTFDRDVLAAPETQLDRARTILGFFRHEMALTAPPPVAPVREVTARRVEPEPEGPIGTAVYEGPHSFQTNWDAIEYGRRASVPERMSFDDQSVQQFISSFKSDVLSANNLTLSAPTADTVLLLRNFVRAKELGSQIMLLDPKRLWSMEWPVNEATAAVLRRAAQAFKVNERDITFGDATLEDFRIIEAPESESAPAPAQARRERFNLIRTLNNYYPSFQVAQALSGDPELRVGVGAFLEQSRLPSDLQQLTRRLLQLDTVVVPPPVAEEPTGALPKLVDRRQQPHVGELILPEGPLAKDGPSSHAEYVALLLKDPHEYFVGSATDEMLATIPTSEWSVSLWVSMFRDKQKPYSVGDIANFIARRVELGVPGRYALDNAKYPLISSNTTVTARSDDDLLPLLRLSKALGLSADTVKVTRRDGRISTLSEWADERSLPRHQSAPAGDAQAAAGTFAPEARATAQAKVEALQQLQSTESTAPTYVRVVEAAHQLLAGSGLAALELAELSVAQREAVLEALTADKHPVAAAVLTGLFTRGASDALERQLRVSGLDAAQAAEWASHAKAIERLDGPHQRFVTEGLEFDVLPLRLELAGRERMSKQELAELYARWRPHGEAAVVRALSGWALLRGQAEPFRQFLAEEAQRGRVQEASLTAGLRGREALRPSEPHAELLALAQELMAADASTAPKIGEALRATLRATLPFVPRAQLVTELLTSLHALDQHGVMALDEVDAQLGGVAAKEWLVVPGTVGVHLTPGELWNALEGVTSFAAVEGVSASGVSLKEVRAKYPRLSHRLALQMLSVELAVAKRFTSGERFVDETAAVEAGARALVEAALGEALTGAKTAEEKSTVYLAGRALLDDHHGWYERIKEQFH